MVLSSPTPIKRAAVDGWTGSPATRRSRQDQFGEGGEIGIGLGPDQQAGDGISCHSARRCLIRSFGPTSAISSTGWSGRAATDAALP